LTLGGSRDPGLRPPLVDEYSGSTTDADFTKQALNLPLPDRLQLVDDLWESILAQAEEIPLTDGQRDELDRRVARYEANPESAKPWGEVRDRLWGK